MECISLLNSDMTLHESEVPVGEEPPNDYGPGGYLRIVPGDRLGGYTVERKLGWGHFLTVWLARAGERTAALKVVKLGPKYTEAARDEIRILRQLAQPDADLRLVRLLDSFDVAGPSGPHVVLVFEVMGENLLQYTQRNGRFLVAAVRDITRQVLEAVDYMHLRGVAHTDIKPENVVMAASVREVRRERFGAEQRAPRAGIFPSRPAAGAAGGAVKVADLGNATPTARHFLPHIQTRQYRAPEVILGGPWGALADVWLVGCLVFELLTGDYLFDPRDSPDFTKDDDHLAQMAELLGHFPPALFLAQCARAPRFFSSPVALRHIDRLRVWPLMDVLVEKYAFDRADPAVRLACDLMAKCLRYDPAERFDCGSLLCHPWFCGSGQQLVALDALENRNFLVRGFVREE